MDSSVAIRSFRYPIAIGIGSMSSLEKPGVVPIHSIGSWNSYTMWKRTLVSSAKTAEAISTTMPDASLDTTLQDSLEKKPLQASTFPNGFQALVLDVCDETEIAELKVKVGNFEMHMKRNIGADKAPIAPPIPMRSFIESAPATPPPSLPKPSPKETNPFVTSPNKKPSKLAALEASGSNTYVLVPSPTVGLFRRGRTVKGKKQPPICNEGDVIKEGQVVGYLDQFSTALPIKSDVAGEVLKLLVEDGEAVGYGDPLIAVLPSFHNIQ